MTSWQAAAATDQDRWRQMMEPASVAHLTGAYDEAEFRYLEALALAESFDADGGFLERSMAGLGGVYFSQSRYAEAAAFYREALEIAGKLYAGKPDRQAVVAIYRETLAAAEQAALKPDAATHRTPQFVFSKGGSQVPLRGRVPVRLVVAEAPSVGVATQSAASATKELTAPQGVRRPIALPSYLPLRGMPVAVFEAKVAANMGWAAEAAVAASDEPAAGAAAADPAQGDWVDIGSGPLVIRITPRDTDKKVAAKDGASSSTAPPAAGNGARREGPKPARADKSPAQPANPAALRALSADPIAPPNVSPQAIAEEQAEETARRRALLERHPVLGIRLPSSERNTGPIFPDTPRLADTEQAYVEELEAREVAYGQRNPKVADLLYRLARLYHKQSRYELAATMYERCLATREKILPEGHPDIIETLKHYIRLMRASGFSDKAAALKERKKVHETRALAEKEQ
jgi:tetratricopeptide (TPR) repeat protein